MPVLRNCEKMSFAGVEGSIEAFGKKARAGRSPSTKWRGELTSISNGGVFGSLTGTPIINPPQSAILGMHSIVWRRVSSVPITPSSPADDERRVDVRSPTRRRQRSRDVLKIHQGIGGRSS